MGKEIVIASNSKRSRLESNLYNMKLRLRIQEEAVKKTKEEIAILEEMLEEEKSK